MGVEEWPIFDGPFAPWASVPGVSRRQSAPPAEQRMEVGGRRLPLKNCIFFGIFYYFMRKYSFLACVNFYGPTRGSVTSVKIIAV